jgi:hypothetical protein
MKRLFLFAIFIMLSSYLFAQESVYVGMTAEEFNSKYPGILPDKLTYNSNNYYKEKLYGIEGRWVFGIYNNVLKSASYEGICKIRSEEDFNNLVTSAGLIIVDYTKTYGQPVTHEKGNGKFIDRENADYEKRINKREVFEEAVWKTNTSEIKISCDYRSNYYDDLNEGIMNGPDEWYSYNFTISYSAVKEIKNLKPEYKDKIYLGMDVQDFAKLYPVLFPDGVKMSGQWMREQDLYGLKGSWGYRFKDGKVDWIHYQKYIDEINEANFSLSLNATKSLIKDYTVVYGKPDSVVNGNTEFIDPSVSHHWGYRVLQAHWKDYNGMKIKVEFIFMGGKGEYHFLVVINYFGKDYPYYD